MRKYIDKRKYKKIVCEWENRGKRLDARALITKPNFHRSLKIRGNMHAIQINRTKTECKNPIYIGFSVLEISKWKMYSFHYNYIKSEYCENLPLNYMGTDSFIYDIKTVIYI